MRISDWSSDVCSSDLDHAEICVIAGGDPAFGDKAEDPLRTGAGEVDYPLQCGPARRDMIEQQWQQGLHAGHAARRVGIRFGLFLKRMRRVVGTDDVWHALVKPAQQAVPMRGGADRSEEQKSELQELM